MRPALLLAACCALLPGQLRVEAPDDARPHLMEQYREIDAWLIAGIDDSPRQRARYWDQDFSSLPAYESSIAKQRAGWAATLGVPPPYSGPLNEKRVPVGETPRLRVDRVWFDAWPGVRVYGVLMRPKDAAGRLPAVITLHGVRGQPELTAGMIPAERGLDFGRALAERGFVTFSAYMISRYTEMNEPQEGPEAWGRDILHKKALMLGMTLVGIEARKLMRAVDYLESLPDVDPNRIGMFGLSKGGQYTLATAALEPRIRATVVSGWFNDRAKKNITPRDGPSGMFFITHTHRTEFYFWNMLHQFGDAELAWLIAPRAFLVENGDKDGAVLIDDARREFGRVEEVYRRLKIPERAVFHGFDGVHEVSGAESFPFLEKWLDLKK